MLIDLRVYIKNAWADDPNRKTIKLSNRRFMVRFGPQGEACREVLENTIDETIVDGDLDEQKGCLLSLKQFRRLIVAAKGSVQLA